MVLFGAGKIGRSFIAQLFSKGGFEVVFVDVSKPVIDAINQRQSYSIIVKGQKETIVKVQHVRGVLATDESAVIKEVSEANLVATAVGQQGLPSVIALIAKGLMLRFDNNPESSLDIIIAENMRHGAHYFEQELKRYLPSLYPFTQLVGLVETSIGKMVPIMPMEAIEHDPLLVYAEPYNTLIIDKKGFKNPIPDIAGLAPKEPMKAWVDRKLFIHNLGHAATAYLGNQFNPSFKFLYEVLEVSFIEQTVRLTMLQSAAALVRKYPQEFSADSLLQHIDDLLLRFKNKALGDTIFRVGCDLHRKLGPNDRICGAIRLARETGVPYNALLKVLVAACRFTAVDEQGHELDADVEFKKSFQSNIESIMVNVCGFNKNDDRTVIEEVINESRFSNQNLQ